VQDVLAVFAAIPATSPAHRLLPVDPFGIETAIAQHPAADPVAAANAVIVRASDPAQTFLRGPQMLKDELERQAGAGRGGSAGTRGGLRALPGGRSGRDTDPDNDWNPEAIEARAAAARTGARGWEDGAS
jgi:hypothetical protein